MDLLRIREEVREERQHRQVEPHVPVGRVRLEDGHESDEGEGEQEGVLPQPDGERDDVDEDVELEGGDEEEAEVLEHLGEEVPEEPHVGRQLGHGEDEAVGGGEEAGVGAHEVEGREQEEPQEGSEHGHGGGRLPRRRLPCAVGIIPGQVELDEGNAMFLESTEHQNLACKWMQSCNPLSSPLKLCPWSCREARRRGAR